MKVLRLVLIFAVVLITTCAGSLIFGVVGFGYANWQYKIELNAMSEAHTDELEGEYYRGLYDVCVSQMDRRVGMDYRQALCLTALTDFRRKQWFEQESAGYEWPLPIDNRQNATVPKSTVPRGVE